MRAIPRSAQAHFRLAVVAACAVWLSACGDKPADKPQTSKAPQASSTPVKPATEAAAPASSAPAAAPAAQPSAAATAPAGGKLYTVGADGTQVDARTLEGFRAWRALACERCHGKNQEGMVGPSLIESMKVLSKDDFTNTVLKGRVEKGMPNFDGSEQVSKNIDGLYAYLKGRSEGAIKPGRLEELK